MAKYSTTGIARHVEGLRGLNKRTRTARSASDARELIQALNALRPKVDKEKRQHELQSREHAPDFNIFSVLEPKTKESFHSTFLGDLLDPRGRHGQRELFLQGFLRRCGYEEDVGPWADEITIRREATIFRGRCDLLIEAPRRLCIIIENKIDAPEGKNQLQLYFEYIQKPISVSERRMLVYLTPQGRASESLDSNNYVRLSYQEDVRKWLAEASRNVKPRNVRSVIEQYMQHIRMISFSRDKRDATE